MFSVRIVRCLPLMVSIVLATFALLSPSFAQTENAAKVLVRVNGEPITEADLDSVLGPSFHSLTDAETKQRVAAAGLKKLIRDKVIEQDAISSRFVNDADINAQVKRYKTQLVSRGYLDSLLAKPPFPTQKEVDDFANQHPDYLSGRQVFHYTDVVLGYVDPAIADKLEQEVATLWKSNTPQRAQRDAFVAWLNVNHVMHLSEDYVQTSEQIQDDRYRRLKEMLSSGQTEAFADADSQLHVLFLLGVYPDPVVLDNVRGILARGLLAKSRAKELDDRVDQLVAQAKIDKIGQVSTTEDDSVSPVSSVNHLGRRQMAWAALSAALLIFAPLVSLFTLRQVWTEERPSQGSALSRAKGVATTIIVALMSIWLVLPSILLLVNRAPLARGSEYRLPILGGLMAGALGAFIWSQLRFMRSRVLPGVVVELLLSGLVLAAIRLVIQ